MATRQEIINKWQQRFPGRKITEDDISNAKKYGLDIIDRTYEDIKGKGTSTIKSQAQPNKKSNSFNQLYPDTGTTSQKIESVRKGIVDLSNSESLVKDMTRKIMEAKQSEAQLQPQAALTDVKTRMLERSISDFNDPNLAPLDRLKAYGNAIARDRVEQNKLQEQIANNNNRITETQNAMRDTLVTQLQGLGMTLDDLGLQRKEEFSAYQNALDRQATLDREALSRQTQLDVANIYSGRTSGGGGGGSASTALTYTTPDSTATEGQQYDIPTEEEYINSRLDEGVQFNQQNIAGLKNEYVNFVEQLNNEMNTTNDVSNLSLESQAVLENPNLLSSDFYSQKKRQLITSEIINNGYGDLFNQRLNELSQNQLTFPQYIKSIKDVAALSEQENLYDIPVLENTDIEEMMSQLLSTSPQSGIASDIGVMPR